MVGMMMGMVMMVQVGVCLLISIKEFKGGLDDKVKVFFSF